MILLLLLLSMVSIGAGTVNVQIQAPDIVVPPSHIFVRISATNVDGLYVVIQILELNKTEVVANGVPIAYGISKELTFHVKGGQLDVPIAVNRSGAVLVGLVGERGGEPVVVVSNILVTLVVKDLGDLSQALALCRENVSHYLRLYEELRRALKEEGNSTLELMRVLEDKEKEVASLRSNLTLLIENMQRLNNSYLSALKTVEELRRQLSEANKSMLVRTVTVTHRLYEFIELKDPWRSVIVIASILSLTLAVLLLARVWRLK